MEFQKFLIVSVCALLVGSSVFVSDTMALVSAFPGAEGSGRFASGGRGGDVYEVNNLSNSGAGSIVDAVSQGNRTIIFKVSGTIELGDVILEPKSNTTIAGQTAPGDGICIKGRIHIKSFVRDIIIRYIRIRVDAGAANSSGDAIDIDEGSNIIIDHVTASYSRDEGISCQEDSNNVTVQWCLISEALTFEAHSYGSLIRGQYGQQKTYHHNLYAHNNSREPRPGNYVDVSLDPKGLYFDFRNNVVYNWKGNYAGYNDDTSMVSRYNLIGNVFITGSESTKGYGDKAFRERDKVAYGYFSNNSYDGNVPSDPWSIVYFHSSMTSSDITAYKARSYLVPMEPVTTTSPAQAKTDVLAGAGASFPKRDIIDTRIVNDVLNKTGHSIVDTASQPEGGWPTLNSTTAPTDSDHDGMPDEWETFRYLNPNDAADRNGHNLDVNYTNLEVYLNGIMKEGTVPSEAAWIQRYNGTSNSTDYAKDIVLDSAGDVIVSGYAKNTTTGYDFVTIKYTPDGNVVWTNTYNRGSSNPDYAMAAAVDAASNIIVAGYGYATTTGYDGLIVKYAPGGSQLWAAAYNYSGTSNDRFYDVATDANGNIYAVGKKNDDCLIVKYTPGGSLAWAKIYNGPANGYDALYQVAIDANGNVYACGESTGSGTDQDCLTLKYSPAGDLLWAKTYNGPANGWDLLEAIAVDLAGNAYVAGSVETATDSNYVTIKYAPDGNSLWTASYSGTATGWDEAYAITLDSDGNVAVTGYSEGTTSADAATVKYNSETGAQLWAARYNGAGNSTDYAEAITADNRGNIYVHGRSTEADSTDYLTICYGTNGTELWKVNYNATQQQTDIGTAIAVDGDGEAVYVTGYSTAPGSNYDFATIKYVPYYGEGHINTSIRHQVLEGFGAANVWSGMSLVSLLVNRPEIKDILFGQLGLDILRLRNTYQTDDGYIDRSATITAAAASSLGHPIKVLLSSWSPPATLKSNGSTIGGTLRRDEFGNYMYNDFAQWWADSINEYFDHGIDVNYVSMQNEPDWQASWDTCRFDPTETADLAGYKEAFEAFYNMLKTAPYSPKILAPEAAGMSGSRNYIDALTETDKSNIYGWAHHLYNWSDGGDAYHPDGYIPVMSSFAADYNDKPRLQTEYSKGDTNALTFTDAMNLAILMHNALVYDEASAYLYWELTWGSPKGLVSITTSSYTINPVYYAFKHYSAFTDPNWQRIETSSTDSNALRISAYISPDNNQMSVVIINTSNNYTVYDLSVGGYNITDGLIYRTSQTENCVLAGRFKNGMSLSLPGRSITTVALTGELKPPSNCQEVQDFGFGLPADLTGDCYVDLLDLQLMTDYWLATTPIDISPPGHSPDIHPDSDNIVNLLDFTDLTAQWLICNDPNVPGCISNW